MQKISHDIYYRSCFWYIYIWQGDHILYITYLMTNLFSYLPFDNLCFFSDKYIIILHRVTLNKIMTISFKIIMKREAIHSIVQYLCFFSDKYIIILHRVTLNKIIRLFLILFLFHANVCRNAIVKLGNYLYIHSSIWISDFDIYNIHSFIHSYEPTCASVVSSEHASAPSSGLSKQHM